MKIKKHFHTNSSSAHAWIREPKQKLLYGESCSGGEFGWQWFLLSRPQDKQKYLAVTLFENARGSQFKMNEDRASDYVNSFFGEEIIQGWPYVDHQSLINIPQAAGGARFPNLRFFQDMLDYVLENKDLVIIGGNDNDDPPVDWGGYVDPVFQELLVEHSETYCTKLKGKRRWEVIYPVYTYLDGKDEIKSKRKTIQFV